MPAQAARIPLTLNTTNAGHQGPASGGNALPALSGNNATLTEPKKSNRYDFIIKMATGDTYGYLTVSDATSHTPL